MRLSRKSIGMLVIAAALCPLSQVRADDSSARLNHRFGFYSSLLGDPFPSLWGVNIGFNLFRFLRLTGGYGSVSATFASGGTLSVTSIGGGAKLFMPSWNFSPVAGINYTNITVSASGLAQGDAVNGISASGSAVYTNLGLSFQAGSGLMIEAGANVGLSGGVTTTPYAALGWFF